MFYVPKATLYSGSNQASIQVITIHPAGLLSPDIQYSFGSIFISTHTTEFN